MEATLSPGRLALEFPFSATTPSAPFISLSELSYLKNKGAPLEKPLQLPFNFKVFSYDLRLMVEISGRVKYFKLLRQGIIWNSVIPNLKYYFDEKS